jgi:hypothetical protein
MTKAANKNIWELLLCLGLWYVELILRTCEKWNVHNFSSSTVHGIEQKNKTCSYEDMTQAGRACVYVHSCLYKATAHCQSLWIHLHN